MKPARFDPRRFIYRVLLWSQALVPVIALLASIASAVRTFVAIRQIYQASVSDAVAIAVSLAFTVAVEGAIFTLSLAQEWQKIKWRQSHKRRHVTTIKTIQRAFEVRIGRADPLAYDQLPEGDTRLVLMIGIAFIFALVSNFYVGVLALTEQSGEKTLQAVITGLSNAPARQQLDFLIDVASVLFPPCMALVAGHQTARFAAGIASSIVRPGTVQPKQASRTAERSIEQQDLPAKRSGLNTSERVEQWIAAHPEITNQHEIARQTGASVGTVNTVVKRSRQKSNSNGHGPGGE